MRYRLSSVMVLIICGVLTLLSAQPQAKTRRYKLMGPSFAPGDMILGQGTISYPQARMTMSVGGRKLYGTFRMHNREVTKSLILRASGHDVTSVQKTYLLDFEKTRTRIAGKTERERKFSSLQGRTVLFTHIRNKWSKRLLGRAPTRKQRNKLRALNGWSNDAQIYPQSPVAIGFRWKLDAGLLNAMFDMGITSPKGKAVFVFQDVLQKGPVHIARIKMQMVLSGWIRDESGQRVRIRLELQGTNHRNLDTGVDAKTMLKGNMTLSSTLRQNGQRIRVLIRGPISFQLSQEHYRRCRP